ncbi:hypothetical protein ACPPVU_08745 [Mucilaginibacter sp. McL0603]|uniref:hypothetical protein n=1 Tax=Mucilaginibacter sp. McL0603 TaxID=3415670 RepID=UPI003CF83CA5
MKPYHLFACFLMLLVYKTSAQTQIKAAEASKYIGEKVFVCDTLYKIERAGDSSQTSLILGGNQSSSKLTVIVKGFALNTGDYSKGSYVCVAGLVTSQGGNPDIEVTNDEMITVRKSYILGSNRNQKTTRITTKVQLTAPPGAHYFGERYRAIDLTDVDKKESDTIKITEKIYSYKLAADSARIDFGGTYPNQKLTIILKGDAKKYLDAMLEIKYKSNDPSHILNNKKFMAIGKVTYFRDRPQIVITDPNLFTIISD